MKRLYRECARRRCIALADPEHIYCAVHRALCGNGISRHLVSADDLDVPDWTLGHIVPVTDRIVYETVRSRKE